MKRIKSSTLIQIALCLCAAILSYLWAIALMDSLYAYRSPLQHNPPQPGPALAQNAESALTQQLVFVLVDALREDTSLDADVMPYLNELRQQAAWATMHSRPPSYSSPGYTVLFTGAWPDVSDGPALNLEYENIPTWTQDNLFSAAHRAGLKTAISAFNWFEKLVPQEAVDAGYFTAGEDQHADRQVVDAALPWLQSKDFQFILIHLDQVDYAGHHEGGAGGEGWRAAAHRADQLLVEIASTLDFSQDTLLVISDHGQIDRGGHGGHDPITLLEPFVLVGAGVQPGHYEDLDMVDVAPTLAALLGLNIPASSQGRIRSDLLALSPTVLDTIPQALHAQQSQLVEAYQQSIGQAADLQEGADLVGGYQATLELARTNRLNAERLPRALLALLAAALPLFWLIRKQWGKLTWLIGAGALYLALFNLRYAIIDQRTYSLSSVASATDIILYAGITAALSLAVTWLVYSWRQGIFNLSPPLAAQAVLDLVLVVIYLLSFPLLWSFALNGALVTWTLPDFPSMFLGFLALLQILFVALLGLLLAGVSAGISAIRSKQKI